MDDIVEDEQIEEEEDDDIGDPDDMADFIVDEDETDEHGQPIRYVLLLKLHIDGFLLILNT